MPCNICYEVFKTKPCEQFKTTTLTVDTSLFLLESKYINDVLYKALLLPHLTSIFHDLRMNCPCKECLVRSACTNGRNCDKYMEIANRNQPETKDKLISEPEIHKIEYSTVSYESEV